MESFLSPIDSVLDIVYWYPINSRLFRQAISFCKLVYYERNSQVQEVRKTFGE